MYAKSKKKTYEFYWYLENRSKYVIKYFTQTIHSRSIIFRLQTSTFPTQVMIIFQALFIARNALAAEAVTKRNLVWHCYWNICVCKQTTAFHQRSYPAQRPTATIYLLMVAYHKSSPPPPIAITGLQQENHFGLPPRAHRLVYVRRQIWKL